MRGARGGGSRARCRPGGRRRRRTAEALERASPQPLGHVALGSQRRPEARGAGDIPDRQPGRRGRSRSAPRRDRRRRPRCRGSGRCGRPGHRRSRRAPASAAVARGVEQAAASWIAPEQLADAHQRRVGSAQPGNGSTGPRRRRRRGPRGLDRRGRDGAASRRTRPLEMLQQRLRGRARGALGPAHGRAGAADQAVVGEPAAQDDLVGAHGSSSARAIAPWVTRLVDEPAAQGGPHGLRLLGSVDEADHVVHGSQALRVELMRRSVSGVDTGRPSASSCTPPISAQTPSLDLRATPPRSPRRRRWSGPAATRRPRPPPGDLARHVERAGDLGLRPHHPGGRRVGRRSSARRSEARPAGEAGEVAHELDRALVDVGAGSAPVSCTTVQRRAAGATSASTAASAPTRARARRRR